MPRLLHIANLWSLVWVPTREGEWNAEQKLRAVKDAGFDGITTHLTPEIAAVARDLGLACVGYFGSGDASKFSELLAEQKENGADHVNVQMADHDTPVEVSVGLAVRLIEEGRKLGLKPAVEVHRDTCTETPEKTYAIADGYQAVTGELLPMTWDHSHLAVVKHLAPPFAERLLVRPDLIQRARQLHLRPFNGHHCQVPVTDGRGNLTAEVRDWLDFAEALLRLWLDGNRESDCDLIVVPEMGPVPGGYNLTTLPSSWEDAKVLRQLIDETWQRVTAVR